MVKLVAMFNLPEGTDEAEFEKFFTKKHAPDAAKLPGLRRYTIGKAIVFPGEKAPWYRINELWFDNMKAAMKAVSCPAAAEATNELSPKVKDFTAVFIKDQEVKLPSAKKAKKQKAKGGKKR